MEVVRSHRGGAPLASTQWSDQIKEIGFESLYAGLAGGDYATLKLTLQTAGKIIHFLGICLSGRRAMAASQDSHDMLIEAHTLALCLRDEVTMK